MLKSLDVEETGIDPQRGGMSLADFEWHNRVLIIFADDSRIDASRQAHLLLAETNGLREREIVVLEVGRHAVKVLFGQETDLDPDAIRYDLDVVEGEFALLLVTMDGSVKLRSGDVVPIQAVFELIDLAPLRALSRTH